MKKTFISLFILLFCALLASTSFKTMLKGYQVVTEINGSECEEMPEDSEEPLTEDNREGQDDETLKLKISYGLNHFRISKGSIFSSCLFNSSSHFPEIDSPPPQV